MATYKKPLQDKDGNFIIPVVPGDQLDWSNVSPCVSEFVFSGTSMPVDNEDYYKTTKRGTQLQFRLSRNACYIHSGADNIRKVRYTINYRHPNTTSAYGVTGLSSNSTCYAYYVGLNNGSATNTSAQNTTGSGTTSVLFSAPGDKIAFASVVDVIRISNDPSYDRRKMWNMLGQIISAGSGTSFMSNIEVTSTTTGTVPSWYQSNVTGTYYYIVVEVWED